MARPASGIEKIDDARTALSQAQTLEEFRQAQTVVLPLDYGLSMKDTAAITGLSVGWACQLRRRYLKGRLAGGEETALRGGRKRENMSFAEEVKFLAPFFEKAKVGGILVVSEIKLALEKKLGRTVALASAYNLLHRHNWRKLAPDRQHPKSDPVVQQAWKKNSPKRSKLLATTGATANRSN